MEGAGNNRRAQARTGAAQKGAAQAQPAADRAASALAQAWALCGRPAGGHKAHWARLEADLDERLRAFLAASAAPAAMAAVCDLGPARAFERARARDPRMYDLLLEARALCESAAADEPAAGAEDEPRAPALPGEELRYESLDGWA